MKIGDVTTAGAIPALQAAMSFAAQRQPLLAHNISNITTPGFRPVDVSIADFQAALSRAVDRRREASGGTRGRLDLHSTSEVRLNRGGGVSITPLTPLGHTPFHDRSSRNLERTMQAMVENASMFRITSDLLRSRMALVRSAIGERV